MSPYFLTFLLLAAGTLLTWFRPQYEEKMYWCCWGAMTACLCFRFAQGTDYVAYHAIYETIPTVLDLSKGYVFGRHPEIGWRLICAAFKLAGAPFWVFTMALGFLEMLLLHRYLKLFVQRRTAGLFLLFPLLYITYMVSGLRQGLAICVFLGIALPFYMEKRWVWYVLGALAAASFHQVGYAWLVLPLVYYFPMKLMAAFVGLALAGGLILRVDAVRLFLINAFPSYHLWQLLFEGKIGYFAVAERLLSFLALFFLCLWYRREKGTAEKRTELLLKAYTCGVCFYMLLIASSYYSSRYCAAFKVLEGAVLLCLLADAGALKSNLKDSEDARALGVFNVRTVLREGRFFPKAVAAFFFCLTLLMGYKNLDAMIREVVFYDASVMKVWNFPYVSVFNQERIKDYFPYENRLMELYRDNIGEQKLWILRE